MKCKNKASFSIAIMLIAILVFCNQVFNVVFALELSTGQILDTGITDLDNATVSYQSLIQETGWDKKVADGEISGTTGQNKKIEAIKIELGENFKDDLWGANPSIEYQVHVQDIGWQDWVKDGALAGTEGQGKKIEAIRIKLSGFKRI